MVWEHIYFDGQGLVRLNPYHQLVHDKTNSLHQRHLKQLIPTALMLVALPSSTSVTSAAPPPRAKISEEDPSWDVESNQRCSRFKLLQSFEFIPDADLRFGDMIDAGG